MIRIVAKVTVPSDQREQFLELIEELVDQCQRAEPATLGLEWFLGDDNVAIVIDTYRDSEAFLQHVANVSRLAKTIAQLAPSTETLVFGEPNDTVKGMLSALGARFFAPAAGFSR